MTEKRLYKIQNIKYISIISNQAERALLRLIKYQLQSCGCIIPPCKYEGKSHLEFLWSGGFSILSNLVLCFSQCTCKLMWIFNRTPTQLLDQAPLSLMAVSTPDPEGLKMEKCVLCLCSKRQGEHREILIQWIVTLTKHIPVVLCCLEQNFPLVTS